MIGVEALEPRHGHPIVGKVPQIALESGRHGIEDTAPWCLLEMPCETCKHWRYGEWDYNLNGSCKMLSQRYAHNGQVLKEDPSSKRKTRVSRRSAYTTCFYRVLGGKGDLEMLSVVFTCHASFSCALFEEKTKRKLPVLNGPTRYDRLEEAEAGAEPATSGTPSSPSPKRQFLGKR